MNPVTIHAAKTTLSRLIARACAGEEVVIARGKIPVVRLVPVTGSQPRRRFGALKGKIETSESWFAPLSKKELEEWGL